MTTPRSEDGDVEQEKSESDETASAICGGYAFLYDNFFFVSSLSMRFALTRWSMGVARVSPHTHSPYPPLQPGRVRSDMRRRRAGRRVRAPLRVREGEGINPLGLCRALR